MSDATSETTVPDLPVRKAIKVGGTLFVTDQWDSVSLNVFGSYADLSPAMAREVGLALLDAADRVQAGGGA